MRHFVVLVTYFGKPTLANPILRRMPTHQVSLVEYFCTQGLLTLVAGESHAHACFGPRCMSVFEVDDDEE